MRAPNENTLPDQFAQRLADLTAELAELSRRVESVESRHSPAQQTNLTIVCQDDDDNSIQLHTENGFVIVRPWEANGHTPAPGAFRFRVQDPDGIEREISVEVSTRLLNETAARTRGRIETASQFWICCAERRLANFLIEHDQFPSSHQLLIETLDREDVLLAIRWGKTE